MKFVLLTAAFSLWFVFSFSQKNIEHLKRCPVKTLNYEQGLLNNSTTNIITDILGFTWISTQTGMQRYNGYVLETVNPVVDKNIISINSPVYFFGFKSGLIWISYKQGVLEYNPHTNSFKKIIALESSYNLNFSIIPIKETSEGIWCLQNKTGIVVYAYNGLLRKKISLNQDDLQNVFNGTGILNNTTFANNQNAVFIYNGSNAIEELNFKTHQTNFIPANNISSFTCSENFIYTISKNEIHTINLSNNQIEKTVPLKSLINENITSTSIFLSGKDQLLVALNGHLFGFDTLCAYQNQFTDLNRNPVVAVGVIRNIYTDKFRRIWLLSNDDIKRIENFDIPFEHFIYDNEKNNFIRSLYYDEKKHFLLAGCYNGGIQLYDTAGNALWQHAIVSDEVKDINAIEKLSDNNFLIETIGRGWYIFQLASKKITPVLLNDKEKNTINVYAVNFLNNLQRINDSTCFIATSNNVFDCVFKNTQLKSVKPLLPFYTTSAEQINCFLYDDKKNLWAGTSTGTLYRMDATQHVKSIRIPENFQIRSLVQDAQYNIWTGTDKGLYVYNNSGALIKSITIKTGLLNDCIYALLPVKNVPAVFASTNLGLSYVTINNNIINYTKQSGLQENEFNTGSAVKTLQEKFYFGGVNGITAFYASSLSNIKDTPILNVTKLVVNDSAYNIYADAIKQDTLYLSYTQNQIQLSFAASGLLNTNEYKYQYRLNGLETNWQTTHEPRDIKYVLPPGKYLFEINCSPIFSSKEIFRKSIEIIISPPWWQTWWFNILMAVLGIIIIGFIIQQYLHRRYQKNLRALQLQHEIQQERERISHDLHDNLGAYAAAIASNISAIKNLHNTNNEDVFNQLKDNSQSIINQLNDTIWALNKESISLTAVSDRFKVFVQKMQPNYPNIFIATKEEITNDATLSPANALHLFRIMQEAVNNALRHSNCKNIVINIISNDVWKIIIKDNGRGMPAQNEKIVYGNGLQNIKARSKAAGWNVKWKSETEKGTELIISPATIN